MLAQPRIRRLVLRSAPRWRHLKVVANDWFDPRFVDRDAALPDHFITLLDPEAALQSLYHDGYLFTDRYFDLFMQALRRGDKGAVASWRTYVYGRRSSGFAPFSSTYTSGSGNEAVPTNSVQLILESVGGGGGGGTQTASLGGGGGGGGAGYGTSTFTVQASEWGNNLAYSVGAAGSNETANTANNAAAGGNSTISGTVGGGAISFQQNGGARTNTSSGAAGGTSTGATTNSSGSAGDDGDVKNPGVAVGGAAGGTVVTVGRGAGGNGHVGAADTVQPVAGEISFAWS